MDGPRIVIVMPRRMHFGPARAGSIDLTVRDFVRFSRFRDSITVVAEEIAEPYPDIAVAMHRPGDARDRLATIRSLAPDLILAQQVVPVASRLAAAFPSVPVVVHRHNRTRAGGRPFWRWRHARRLRRLARIVHVSDFCTDDFKRLWPEFAARAATVHNGVDSVLVRPAPWEAREKIVAFAGRADPNKGALELARALALVLPAAPPGWRARLCLAYPARRPEYAAAVESAVASVRDRVDIVPDAPFDDVVDLFSRAAVAVTPTVGEEAFGRTALEAMLGGAALVSATCGGLSEVVGQAALRVDPVTPESLASALTRALADAPLRRRLGESGRKRAESLFDIRRVAREMDEILAETLSERPAAPR